MHRRDFMKLTGAGVAVSLAMPAWAREPLTYQNGGVAINGYDPVAYFTQSDAVEGDPTITFDHDGATYQFASTENRDMFASDPEAFAPQYGGYCAYAVSKGYTASTDPHAWTVHENKLYLNFSKSVQGLWTLRRSHHIRSADMNWPSVLG